MIFYGFILGTPALQQHLLGFSSAAKIFKGILWDLQNLDEEYEEDEIDDEEYHDDEEEYEQEIDIMTLEEF